MEPLSTSGFTKIVSTFKDFPLWLLTGIALSLFVFLYSSNFGEDLPSAMRMSLKFGTIFSASLAVCRFVSVRLETTKRRNSNRFTHIYRPLSVLLLTTHVTMSSSTGAPRFRDRWENAIEKFATVRRRRRAIRAAVKALFD